MSAVFIPDPGEQGLDSQIPAMAGELPQGDDPEVLPFKISFARYNSKECEISEIEPANAKAALITLRDVGIYFTSENAYAERAQAYSEIKYVNDDGDYHYLYNGGLGEEGVEIKEIKIQKQNKGVDIRLFFFSLERERTFYLLAVRQSHIDTTKGRFHKKVKKFSRAFRK